eukprot:540132_1
MGNSSSNLHNTDNISIKQTNVDEHKQFTTEYDQRDVQIASTIKELRNDGFSTQEIISAIHLSAPDDEDGIHINKTLHCNSTCKSQCQYLNRFLFVMRKYTKKLNSSDINILEVVNDYIHLIHEHKHDEDFEFICNALGPCNILDCGMFARNNRIKCNYDLNPSMELDEKVYREFMDKMHCFFCHCFDIGNRVNIEHKKQIQKECKQNQNDNPHFIDNALRRTKQILASKRNKCPKSLIQRSNSKYNQLQWINKSFEERVSAAYKMLESSNNCDDKKDEFMNIYDFGYRFRYGYEHEDAHYGTSHTTMKNRDEDPFVTIIDVKPKYSSLKEELTCNEVIVMTMEQFKIEYRKSEINFASRYCKRLFRRDYTEPVQIVFQEHQSPRRNEMKLCLGNNASVSVGEIKSDSHKRCKCNPYEFSSEILLSLMIYCNYTALQYQFSKTYRDDCGAKHNNFWFWGKNLKIGLSEFGTEIKDGNISSFYHGIDKQMTFSMYFSNPKNTFSDMSGVYIYGPLSTSASFEVAVNFSNNTGLIVEFNDNISVKSCKYFSVDWLSDYGNEKECLFVQNDTGLLINNIWCASVGMEYGEILHAIQIMDMIIYNKEKISNISSYITDHTKALIIAIIHNQLAKSLTEYSPFYSLQKYGQKILQTYFEKQMEPNPKVFMPLEPLKIMVDSKNKFVFDIFYDSIEETIKFREILAFNKNVKIVTIKNINVTFTLLENLFEYLQHTFSEITTINIHDVDMEKDLWKLVSTYQNVFKNIYYNITVLATGQQYKCPSTTCIMDCYMIRINAQANNKDSSEMYLQCIHSPHMHKIQFIYNGKTERST